MGDDKKLLDNIPEGLEDEDNDDVNALDFPDKPSYFNMFDDDEVDSEEDMVAGENNYIEIECLPLEGQAPAEENKQQPAAEAQEEEKKEAAADDRSSQYKGSEDNNEEKKEENKEENKEEVKEEAK